MGNFGCIIGIFEENGGFGVGIGDAAATGLDGHIHDFLGGEVTTVDVTFMADLPILTEGTSEVTPDCGD